LPDCAEHTPCQGLHHNFSAENRCGKRHLNCCINIGSLPFKSRTCSYMNLHKQISRLAAARSRRSLATKPDALAVHHSFRNVYLQRLNGTVLFLKPDHLIASKCGFIKADRNFCMDILSSALIGTASKSLAVEATESAITSAAASAEHTSKDISEKIIHISAFEIELAIPAVLTADTSKPTEALPGSL